MYRCEFGGGMRCGWNCRLVRLGSGCIELQSGVRSSRE